MTHQYTCITCRVGFRDPEVQREHYKTDWHRYNLKRKVAELEPVAAEEFSKRVLQQRESDAAQSRPTVLNCKPCNKSFNSKNAFENHVNSKKHKIADEKYNEDAKTKESESKGQDSPVSDEYVMVNHKMVKPSPEPQSDGEYEEVDSDEWEDIDEEGSLIKPNDCLFCEHHSHNTIKNLAHMTTAHSFFIPDAEFCTDVTRLLLYLGEKISRGYMCLWCNDTGRAFRSQQAAQGHMRDKGHCKVLHEGEALAEYTEFYDYSSSYPDHEEGDEEMEVDDETAVAPSTSNDEEEYQLVLPSGSIIGHRSLLRYYKQNLISHSGAVVAKKHDKLTQMLRQYRMLGYAPQDTEATARKARDIKYMRRVQNKWAAQLGIKANKLQHHFRVASNY